MVKESWIFISIVLVAVPQKINAACVCNKNGDKSCGSSSEILAPNREPSNGPQLKLPPTGDYCWCSETIVKPAPLTNPFSKHKNPPQHNGCPAPSSPASYVTSNLNNRHQQVSGQQPPCPPSSYVEPEVNFLQTFFKDDSPPADPISISLAKKAGKANEVPEAKLAYGFVREPINALPRAFASTIKEENLYALANEIITLNKPLAPKIKNQENNPEPEQAEPAAEAYEPPSPTYKELGYEMEQFKTPEYLPMPALAKAIAALSADKGVWDCIFNQGHMENIREIGNSDSNNCLTKY